MPARTIGIWRAVRTVTAPGCVGAGIEVLAARLDALVPAWRTTLRRIGSDGHPETTGLLGS